MNGCEAYIDDVIIYSNNWGDHVEQIGLFLISCMKKVNLHDNQSDKKWIWLADIKYVMELHASVHSEYKYIYNDDYEPQTIWNQCHACAGNLTLYAFSCLLAMPNIILWHG